jgi:hypothetical protein
MGSVTLDGVAHAPATNELLIVECKSGANIEEDQARKLAVLEPESVVRSAAITLSVEAKPTVEVFYLCLEGHTNRVVLGLSKVGWTGPVLELCLGYLRLVQGSMQASSLQGRFDDEIELTGPPPGFVTVDSESPNEAFDTLVLTALIGCQAQRLDMISARALTERAIPHLAIFGKAAKGLLERKVSQAAGRIAEQYRDNYVFQPSSERREAAVRILKTPEDADPRGRTQGYQALARRRGEPRRRLKPEIPGQTQFESVLEELEAADNTDEEGGDDVG